MPIYTFNYTSPHPTGEAKTFRQQIQLLQRPPRGSRFHIRQVSATSTDTFENSFKYVSVYIPELMDATEQIKFIHYTLDSNGTPQIANVPFTGFRYFLSDAVSQPFALNVFPNLNLGRHTITPFTLTLELTPFADTTTVAKLHSYSVVIEWDTE